jgi:hypothetical protein
LPVTSLRQWTANRENAQKSTGPRTEEGKRGSRRNALRHGLTAETVIDGLEDSEDYRAFEAAVIADYDATTAVERELVLRLASLLWRIRRTTGIETDLFRIQAEIILARQANSAQAPAPPRNTPHAASRHFPRLGYRVLRPVAGTAPQAEDGAARHEEDAAARHGEDVTHEQLQAGCRVEDDLEESARVAADPARQPTHCFLRLANLDNAVFDRLNRYEARLWRQFVQTWFALQPLRDRQSRLV